MLEIQTIQKQDTTLEGYDDTSATLRMIPDSSDLTSLSARYEAELQAASKVGAETVFFPSLSCASQPLLFRAISQIYRTILDFGDAGESSIKKVCIVCEDDAVRNTYMVVWNFYYAGTKSARMNDGRWD